MINKWIWLPTIGVNEFFLNKECSKDLLIKYNFNLAYVDKELADNELDFEYISKEFGISITLTNDLICSGIEIQKNLCVNDISIIGLPINKFINIMKNININDLTLDLKGDFYQSEKLNALFWIEDNIITSVSCW